MGEDYIVVHLANAYALRVYRCVGGYVWALTRSCALLLPLALDQNGIDVYNVAQASWKRRI